MRVLVARLTSALGLVAALCTACGTSSEPGGSTESSGSPGAAPSAVDLSQVNRTRSQLPAGFEFAPLAGRVAPVSQWGLGAQWSTQPPHCSALIDPPVAPATIQGWSASGPGAIVYAVAADAPTGFDPAVRAECDRFTVAAGHTSGNVAIVDAPAVADAETIGLRADTLTVVEGGTETHSRADTLAAILGAQIVYVTVVTDPGSSETVLEPDFAARLLTTTASALRGSPPAGG